MQQYDPTANVPAQECALCGRDGGPIPSCQTCHGRAGSVPRAYTLSDLRTGRVKLENRTDDLKLKEYDPYQGDSQ